MPQATELSPRHNKYSSTRQSQSKGQNLDVHGTGHRCGHCVQETMCTAPEAPVQVFFQPGGMFRGIPRRYTKLERDAATPGAIFIFAPFSPNHSCDKKGRDRSTCRNTNVLSSYCTGLASGEG
jgi:hypothetical protein